MKMTMGLESGHISPDDLTRAKSMVPKALQSYVEQMARTGVMPAQGLSSKVSRGVVLLLNRQQKYHLIKINQKFA